MNEQKLIERAAQLIAHRCCGGAEHDPQEGKLHGYCTVCLVPWPCEYAGTPPTPELPVPFKISEPLCPACQSPIKTRERRPDGDATCFEGHKFPIKDSVYVNAGAAS